jgi:hypothetical protein
MAAKIAFSLIKSWLLKLLSSRILRSLSNPARGILASGVRPRRRHTACARVLTLRGLGLHDRGAVGSWREFDAALRTTV